FEGQARFAQLQYLYFVLGAEYTWTVIEADRMLSDRYTKAFKFFLELTGFSWPDTVSDPLVGLFLLVCDIAINPAERFSLTRWSFSTFVTDVNPCMRFAYL